MKAWEEYAICDENGYIQNILVFQISTGGREHSNILAKEQYGADAFSFNITQYMAKIGDRVVDGDVYRDGETVHCFPTEEEEIRELDIAIDELIIASLGG